MTSVVLAKALYNNDSEADDELSFKKGDVVTVLETDFEGMAGWWLCALADKQGVAPGNRLQLLSYGDDQTDGSHDTYDSPGSAYKKKYGDVDYDVPKPHNGLTPSEYPDYAIPKTPYGDIPLHESQRHGFVLPSPRSLKSFDVRNSNSSDGLVSNEVYDAPSRWSSERSSVEFRFSGEVYQESGPEEMYDVPSRNSMESDDGASGQQGDITLPVPLLHPQSRSAGNGDQGDSSGWRDIQEIYDSPTSVTQDMKDGSLTVSDSLGNTYDKVPLVTDGSNKRRHLLQSVSGDSGIYDTLPDELYDVPSTVPDDTYDVPAGESTQSFYESMNFPHDGNNNPPTSAYYDEMTGNGAVYAVPHEKNVARGVYDNCDIAQVGKELRVEGQLAATSTNGASQGGEKKAKKHSESDDYVDYQEIYGMGQEEPEDPQMGNKSISVYKRIHMEKVRELDISHSDAMANLDKLQQAVDVAVTKLLSFVTEDWRQPEVLSLNINGIRDISGKMKVALRLLTEFGLSTVVNSQKLSDNEISRKIKEALEPLLQTYYSVKSAIQRLDKTDWKSAYQMNDDDDLNRIAKMARGIPCDAYNLGAVIANISSLLFKKTPDEVHTATRSFNTKIQTQHPTSLISSSPAVAQKESVKGLEVNKVASEPVGMRAKHVIVSDTEKKPPPKISPKPKKDRSPKRQGSNAPVSVSELTNNLLNQIEDMKTPRSFGLTRKASKKLSPKTVRRLCSIGLTSDDKNSEKILEDVTSVPPKPSRQCSSPAEPGQSSRLSLSEAKAFLGNTLSDPGIQKSSSSAIVDSELSVSVKNRILSFKGEEFDLLSESEKSRRNDMEGVNFTGNNDAKNVQRFNSVVEKMDNQFVILKEGIKSFVESVRECQEPKVFVAHSKFIVLSAHKLVYVGDGASRRITNINIRNKISEVTNSLSEVINDFVENIKNAAREYPDENALNVMIKSAAKVTEMALQLYKTLGDHA